MTTFTDYQNILPDPLNPIGTAGQPLSTGTKGPGFKSVRLTSKTPTLQTKTNSGRLLSRAVASHSWNVSLAYNPMTEAEVSPIIAFLMGKRGGLLPFFVSLPQYRLPKSSSFSTWVQDSSNSIVPKSGSSLISGQTTLLVDLGTSYAVGTNGKPTAGDLFTINDPNNSNHKKAYMITSVEDANTHNTSNTVGTSELKLHFFTGTSAKFISNS